jgi:hypothetical protein
MKQKNIGLFNEKVVTEYLDWKNRPEQVKLQIKKAFVNLQHTEHLSNWRDCGAYEEYLLADISECALTKTIIKQHPEEKEFFILDVGAGDFGCSLFLANFLNSDIEIPKDIKVHIISIRGEPNPDLEVQDLGICKLYNLGCFPIENLLEEFERRGFNLLKKINLCLSRMALRHCVDPIGTYMQIYSLIKPKTGLLLIDGFFYLRDNELKNTTSWWNNTNMYWLLLHTKAPFFVYRYNSGHSLDQFVIRRPDDQECQLPLNYVDTQSIEPYPDRLQVYSRHLTSFKQLTPNFTIERAANPEHLPYSGDKDLFDFVLNSGSFSRYFSIDWGYAGPFLKENNSEVSCSDIDDSYKESYSNNMA